MRMLYSVQWEDIYEWWLVKDDNEISQGKLVSQNLAQGAEENHSNLSEDIRILGPE
jgi:hypothetical protein